MTMEDEVGPVFSMRSETPAYVAAIRRHNAGVRFLERSSYVRILALKKCVLSRIAVEEELGERVRWPECLEAIMPSFKGRFSITGHFAEWNYP